MTTTDAPLVSRFARYRARFRLIWLAPILALIALSAWAFASPIASAPDDDFHLVSIWCSGVSASTDCADAGPGQREVPVALLNAPCFAYDDTKSASCQSGFLADDRSAVSGRGNFNGSYPPVYYAAMGVFATDDFMASALVMRFVTIVLYVALTTALFVLLPTALRRPLLWAWLVTVVPLGMFLLASNNPSSWAMIGIGSAWLALLGYMRTEGRRRIALGALFAFSALLAAGSRGDAAVYVILSIGIVGILTVRLERSYWLQLILPAAVAIVCALLFLTTQQSAAAVVGEGLGDAGAEPPGGLSSFALLAYNLLNIPGLWAGIFAGDYWGLGWLDTGMPAVVTLGAIAVFVAIVFSGLRESYRRKTIALTLLGLTLWLLPTYVLTKGMNAVGTNVQPRYFLPLIIVFAGLAVLTIAPVTFSKLQLAAIATTLSIAQLVALHTNIRRYVTGVDAAGWNLNDGIEWWWYGVASPMVVWIIGTLAFTGLVVILVRQIGSTRAITE